MPDGTVYNVEMKTSSGNSMFDRNAVSAVYKASPLPVGDMFEHFREGIELILTPPED